MDLLEYQAKELFQEIGIPILPSQPIGDPSELKRLHIPYPIVLKSQVRAGGRGKAGGIRFVENTIDAIAAARTIFNLPILGEYPQVILAEARYDAQQEVFLAVILDYQLQRPVLLGSACGGMNVDALLEALQMVVIEEDFSPFYARRLALKMGLQGKLIAAVSTIVEKMYHLFWQKDLDLVEINPLGVSALGEVMALDGKISANDAAIARHRDLLSLTLPQPLPTSEAPLPSEAIASPSALPRWIEGSDDRGTIGILCNSLGLALATWDLIAQDRGKPAFCAMIGEAFSHSLPLEQQLKQCFDRALDRSKLQVILINILGSPETLETVAQALCDYLQPYGKNFSQQGSDDRISRPTGAIASGSARSAIALDRQHLDSTPSKPQPLHPLHWIVRFAGGDREVALKEDLLALSVYWADDLEQAISQTLALAKSKA
jgi:succinyl-CoA synthetase beta subunit